MKVKLIILLLSFFFLSACSVEEKITEEKFETEVSFTYNSENLNISYHIPDSWEKYWYDKKLLDEDWVIRFLDNNDFMIVNLNIYTIEEWEEQKQEWLFNNEKLLESENYVISYSETLDMPYEDEDDIQTYSNMIDDVSYFLDSVELNY